MIRAKSFLIATTLLFPISALTQTETASLRWHPVKGDQFSYEFVVKTDIGGTPYEATSLVSSTVTEVRADESYTIKSERRGSLVRVGANETRDDRVSTTTARHNADGRLVSMQGQEGIEGYRFASFTKFVAPPMPVKTGDSWRIVHEKDRPQGAPSYETTYRFEKINASEKGKTAEISFAMKETSGANVRTANGKWIVDMATGLPISMEAKATGLIPDADSVTVQIKRVSGSNAQGAKSRS